jgi:4-hydroxybenzoate polyprenyltransferase
VFISACAFFLTVETALLAGIPVSLPMAAFVFLATLFTYNLNNIQRVLRKPKRQIKADQSWAQRHRLELALLGMAAIAGAAVLYVVYNLQLNIWFMLHLALISVGYTIPVLYKAKKVRPLRSVPLLKVFLIAYVWAAVTALFPLMDAGVPLGDQQALLLFGRRFLFILALALLFDIRDYTYDRTTKTLTFPGLIGIRNTKLLSLGLLLLYVVVVMLTERGTTEAALVASAVGAGLVVFYASENKPPIYYVLLADGAMLLHAGLVYLANSLYLH